MSDFIREVDEEYRRDRAVAFFSRYQVPIALAVVLVIAGAGGYRFWADRQVTAAEKVNDQLMAASDLAKAGKPEAATAAYEAIAKDGPPGYAMLARLRAAETLAARDPEAAAKAFDALAGDDTMPVSLRDTARMRGAMIRIDRDDPKAFEQRYGRFSEPGFTYTNSIRELLALAALKRQDMEAAGRYLDAIIVDPNAPAALRGRAEAFRTLVTAGPASDMATQPPPASVAPLGGPPPVATVPTAPAQTPAAAPSSAPARTAPVTPAPIPPAPAPATPPIKPPN